MCHCVKEHRQRSHQGLTFTRCHLSYLTLVQYYTTKQLHVVVNHVPCYLVTASDPVVEIDSLIAIYLDEVKPWVGSQVFIHIIGCHHNLLILGKTASGRFNDSVCFRQNLVQHSFVGLLDFLFELINLVIYLFALIYL